MNYFELVEFEGRPCRVLLPLAAMAGAVLMVVRRLEDGVVWVLYRDGSLVEAIF